MFMNNYTCDETAPVFATCECCGRPIYRATDFLEGQRSVELYEDEFVHVDCIDAWVREHEKEAV